MEELVKYVLKLIKINDEVLDDLVRKYPEKKISQNDFEEESELSEKLSQEFVELEENKEILKETKSVKN